MLALEVEPNLVEHMQARFKDQPQVEVRHIGFDGPGLAPASVDLLVMVDVYHHIEDRPAYFASALPALRPGGRLVVVDFIMDEIPVGPPPGHRIAAETVTQELQQAGFAPAGSLDLLPYQFVQIYRVPAP